MTRPRRARRPGVAVLAGGALVLGLVVAPGRAPGVGAAPARDVGRDDVRVEVAGGIQQYVAPNRTYPVVVTVEADRLFRGTVQVEVDTLDGPMTLQRSVEVAAGNTEQFLFLAPPAVVEGILAVKAALTDGGPDGPVLDRADDDLRIDPDFEVVGVLPPLAAGDDAAAEVLPLAVADAGGARLFDVDPELLTLGPLALEPLDQLVITASALVGLAEAGRAAVATWVSRGGCLLVVGDAGAGLGAPASGDAVLPAAWQPAPGGAVRAGLGRVRSVGDDWRTTLLPSSTRSQHEEQALINGLPQIGGSVTMPLAEVARAELPPARGLGLLLLVYVLLVGPVGFLVVRRLGRRQLAWLLVPVLAGGATGVTVAAGDSLHTSLHSAQVTVYETGPDGTTATSWSVLTTPRGGEARLALPVGWTAGPSRDEFLGLADRAWLEVGDDGTAEVVAEPPAGGHGMVEARGPVRDQGEMLVVEARSEADGIVTGTVRNQSEMTLEHVATLLGRTGVAEVGTLAPGEARAFTIEGATNFDWGVQPELAVWPWDESSGVMMEGGRFAGPGGALEVELPDPPAGDEDDEAEDDDDEPAGLGDLPLQAWSETMVQTGLNYRPPGQVLAVGWTDALGSPVHSRGATAAILRLPSAVVARGTVAPGGDRLTDAAVVRSFVRGPITENIRRPQAASAPVEREAGAAPDEGDRTQAEAGVVEIPGDAPPPVEDPQPAEPDDGESGVVIDGPVVRDGGPEIVLLPPRPGPRPPGGQPGGDGEELGVLYGFDLPAAVAGRPVDTSRLALGIPDRFLAAELWTPSGWVPLGVPASGEQIVEVTLPPEAVVGGMVFVRAAVPNVVPDPGRELVLYERATS